MGKQILVITSANDPHVELVRRYSSELTLLEYNTDQPAELTGRTSSRGSSISVNNQELDIDVVWYRKPCLPEKFFQPQMPNVPEFVIQEYARATSWLPSNVFDGRPWVSRPELIARASNRLLQLSEAVKVGLNVPETIITNSPLDAEHFCEQHKWRVVAKTLGPPVLQIDGAVKAMNARLVTEEERKQLASIKHCPTILQQHISAIAEYRVTVFGSYIFAFEISRHPGATGFCYKDDVELAIRPFRLPWFVANQCIRLVKSFDLAFSSMDILLDNEGSYQMIDLNPNGQWAWLDEKNETGMLSAFGHYLAHLK